MRTDWELRQLGDFGLSPNARGRREDYPVNDSASPIAASMFNAVGGSTILYAAHFPRFHPSDFKVRTLDGVADDWPIDYQRLAPFYDVNAHMMGVSGLAGDPMYPPKEVPLPPVALGKLGETLAPRLQSTRLALVAVGQRDHHAGIRRPRAVHQRRHVPAGMSAGRQGQHRHHLLAGGAAAGRDAQDALPGARDHRRRNGMADGVIYYDAEGVERRQKAHVVVLACNGIGTPRLLLNSRSTLFPDGLANRSGLVGKNLMFHPYAHGDRYLRRAARKATRARPVAAS